MNNKGAFPKYKEFADGMKGVFQNLMTSEYSLMPELRKQQRNITMLLIVSSAEVVQHGERQFSLQCVF